MGQQYSHNPNRFGFGDAVWVCHCCLVFLQFVWWIIRGTASPNGRPSLLTEAIAWLVYIQSAALVSTRPDTRGTLPIAVGTFAHCLSATFVGPGPGPIPLFAFSRVFETFTCTAAFLLCDKGQGADQHLNDVVLVDNMGSPGSRGSPEVAEVGFVLPPSSPLHEPCSICLLTDEEIEETVAIAFRSWCRLPCGHRFHKACVGQWLTTGQRRCPLCRDDPLNHNT